MTNKEELVERLKELPTFALWTFDSVYGNLKGEWEDYMEFSESIESFKVCKECGGRCCEDCSQKYFNIGVDFRVEKIDKYVELFDEEKGFRGKDGCKLPRRMRPFLCIRYRCPAPHSHDDIIDVDEIDKKHYPEQVAYHNWGTTLRKLLEYQNKETK